MKEVDDPRREFLVNALSAGLYAVATVGILPPVWAMGKVPEKLVPGKSIYDLSGEVTVDGKPATEATQIGPNSSLSTGENSHVIFVVGQDAFVMRSNSRLKLQGNGIISTIRLLSGKLLSVFGRREQQQKLSVKTTTATIGIRGTGMYVEAETERTYVCTCYGTADLQSNQDEQSREQVKTRHHDAPRFILANGASGQRIVEAPVFNHSDDELALIETLVGREVPFTSGGYSSPRNNRY